MYVICNVANVVDGRNVEHRGGLPLMVAELGKGFEEGIGGAVAGLAQIYDNRVQRTGEEEKV
jgi:hypothetical protein